MPPTDSIPQTDPSPDTSTAPQADASKPGANSHDNFHNTPAAAPRQPGCSDAPQVATPDPSGIDQTVPQAGVPFQVRALRPPTDAVARHGSGRRQRSRSDDRHGHVIGSRPTVAPNDLALDATVRAAAIHQRARHRAAAEAGDSRAGLAIIVQPVDWRAKVRIGQVGSCVVFVVDASGSMASRGRMVAAKGAVLSLLLDAYVRRDKVGLVAFRGRDAKVLLAPTSSIDRAHAYLRELPVGGRTPLASGLVAAGRLVRGLTAREPTLRPLVIVVSDGHSNVDLAGTTSPGAPAEALQIAARLSADDRARWVVVDSHARRDRPGEQCQNLAAALGAPCYAIDDLRADDLVGLATALRKEKL